MSKKINLEEILRKHSSILDEYPMPFPGVFGAMREAIKQALELAAENAKVTPCNCFIDEDRTFIALKDGRYVIVDKQSILDTINQIE